MLAQQSFTRFRVAETLKKVNINSKIRAKQRKNKKAASRVLLPFFLYHEEILVMLPVAGRRVDIVPVPAGRLLGLPEPDEPDDDSLAVLFEDDIPKVVKRNVKTYEVLPPLDQELNDASCSICLENDFSSDLRSGNVAIKTCCSHFFHRKCIQRHMRAAFSATSLSNKCPICRGIIQETEVI